MKRYALAVLLSSLLAGFLCGTTWNAGFEASPAGTDLASDLDTFIQTLKLEIRNRGSVETVYGTGSNDNGLLRLGAARCYMQNAEPMNITGPGAYNSSAGTFSATPLGTNEPNGTIDIGTGRCWIDLDGLDGVAGNTDDRQLNTWVDTVGWVAVVSTPTSQLAENLIYNGSFEITDGTGSTASVTIPTAWTVVGAPTFTYTDPVATSEGEGVAVNITGVGANSGIQQTLSGLKASTAYILRARVNPTTAADVCNLNVTGGAVSPTTDSTTATGAFELVDVNVTTTAGAAPLVVQLRTTNATDVCRWDHVTVFEASAAVSQPGIQACRDTDDSTTNAAYTSAAWTDALVSCSVTIPSPGYIIRIEGELVADGENGGLTAIASRLREDCGAGAATVAIGKATSATDSDAAGQFQDMSTIQLSFLRTPTALLGLPGQTCTYTMEARAIDTSASFDRNVGDDGTDDLTDATTGALTQLSVELVPTR